MKQKVLFILTTVCMVRICPHRGHDHTLPMDSVGLSDLYTEAE